MGLRTKLREHAGLLVLCVLFLAVIRLEIAVLAPFEGPDEGEHLAYVVHLRKTGQLPTYDDFETTAIKQQVSSPPLYYVTAALYALPYNFRRVNLSTLKRNPWHGGPASPTSNDNRNYAMMHPDYQTLTPRQSNLSAALIYTRGVSVIFGWLTLAGMYWGGLALWHDRRWALLAAMIFGFSPPALQIFASVSNDTAVTAFTALSIGGILHLTRGWNNPRLLIVTGLFLGLAGLSKVSGLALFPIAGLAVLWGWWQQRRTGAASVGELLRAWILMGTIATALCGWWYVRGYLLYHDPFGTIPHQQMSWGFAELQSVGEVLQRLPLIVHTLWINAGWGEVRPEFWGYILPVAYLVVAAAGLLAVLSRASLSPRRVVDFRAAPDFRAVMLLITMLLGLIALIRWMQMSDYITGRLYLPYVPALVLLLVWGIRAAPLSKMWRLLFAGASGGMAVVTAGLVLYPAFVAPRFVDALPENLQGTPIEFGIARFVGYHIDSRTIRTGDELQVTLCWQAPPNDAPIPVPYPFTIQIIELQDVVTLALGELVVGQRESYTGMGKYTRWQPGTVFCDAFELPISEPITAGQAYGLYVTLFDPETTVALHSFDAKVVGILRGGR